MLADKLRPPQIIVSSAFLMESLNKNTPPPQKATQSARPITERRRGRMAGHHLFRIEGQRSTVFGCPTPGTTLGSRAPLQCQVFTQAARAAPTETTRCQSS
ncbi:hypothetical protein SKAU_G00374600 [Synaphobranchus kaupii]|uniref:Uncharacterized protein n=1 Tax=Synaphobranchus kaupii TaxID=118154 RepID=A0A9Q1EGQ9_SYNKA|nr:hypothetical protein SKAU_G00374600 [Synaphobranchus kaupii]